MDGKDRDYLANIAKLAHGIRHLAGQLAPHCPESRGAQLSFTSALNGIDVLARKVLEEVVLSKAGSK